MKRRSIFLLFLLPLLAAKAQFTVPTYVASSAGASSTPAVVNPACFTAATTNPYTTSPAIDTTGVKVIAISVSYLAGTTITVSDNKSNGNATALTAYGGGANNTVQIFYWLSPTVGSGHTFTISGSPGGPFYGVACVAPITHLTGAFDAGTDKGATFSGGHCQPASINPGAGTHMLITGVGAGTATVSGIDSSFSIDANVAGVGGTNYQGAIAHLLQNPGAGVSPSWAGGVGFGACAIASFH